MVTWQDSYHLYLPPMTLDNSALIFLTCSLLCRPWDFRWGNFAGLTLIQFVFLAPLWPFVSYAETLKYQASQRTNPDNPSIANVFSWSETARNKVRQPRIKCFIHQLLFSWYWQSWELEIADFSIRIGGFSAGKGSIRGTGVSNVHRYKINSVPTYHSVFTWISALECSTLAGGEQNFSLTSSEPFCLGGYDGSSMQDCTVADPKGSPS